MNGDEELLDELSAALSVSVPDASADRIAAVRAAALRQQAAADHPSSGVTSAGTASGRVTSRRALMLSAAAAAFGAAAGAVVVNSSEDEPTAAPGPPTEALTFSASAAAVSGSSVSGKVVNHAWGVELMLDADGFPDGTKYRVVYIDSTGSNVDAGGFVGADVPIRCHCNGPLLRSGIAAIEIRDTGGALVSRATFT